MKLAIKCASILVLLLLASPLILVKGCGKAMTGGSSGACPDSVAPDGSTITAPTLGTPSVLGSCFSGVGFKILDSNKNPMNGICVEVTTDAAIALHTVGDADCNNVILSPKTTIVTRTDDTGTVSVDLVTLPTTSGTAFFVEAASGALSAIATTPTAK